MREIVLQKTVVQHLRKLGVLFVAPLGETGALRGSGDRANQANEWITRGALRGAPDILILDRPPAFSNFVGVAMELKTGSGRLRPEQKRVLSQLESRGWFVCVPRSVDEVLELLKNLGWT